MREVQGAVVAIVLVLCAVFVPVAFLGGIAGKLYQQFAVTVAIAVVISGVVALTLTPALCALLLKQPSTRIASCSAPSTAVRRAHPRLHQNRRPDPAHGIIGGCCSRW
jgi:multidrug efflux pump subunit AcrB